jgi:hypothetical protein
MGIIDSLDLMASSAASSNGVEFTKDDKTWN